MSAWIAVCGALAGLGVFVAVSELIPAGHRISAALERLGQADSPAAVPVSDPRLAGPWLPGSGLSRRLGRRLAVAAPWLPVPSADLALLGQDRAAWLASKVTCGVLGVAAPVLLTALLALAGQAVSWPVPVAAALGLGAALFFAPDLVTRVNAAEKRYDFRHALSSYLDLVSLERGAGAGPTEALEAAAAIGGGWAFERIAAALDAARRVGAAPWTALAGLAAETGVTELADLADIAEVAGQEGARILDTLAARAASMRAQALAADRAKAGARGTTMVVPIALLAVGFLVLLIFPILYRTFLTA
ncbi:MAG TPA: type II secretion system F family protein [Streptosporangiaceae bacterium]|nr:type II secretion system F family protein [Streptosporangiaceae bacterium]